MFKHILLCKNLYYSIENRRKLIIKMHRELQPLPKINGTHLQIQYIVQTKEKELLYAILIINRVNYSESILSIYCNIQKSREKEIFLFLSILSAHIF